ncbi:MAG: DNA ligase D [Chitinophagaceae bacterium]|nr:DNA ligase D [Chitinophagaceae bacterium]
MALTTYRQKRSFKSTPEPAGGKSKTNTLAFVVQKHQASRLHYDFRLEMKAVLKSWAIPKGPSLDPAVKRLAVMVEDHPYDYKNFEGIIPEGNYGAGSVIIWDEGYYETTDGTTGKEAMEKSLLKQLKEGSIKIRLYGKKLKGEFAMVKTKGMEDNAWLLIKHKDSYAAASDILRKDRSVVSNKTNASLEKQKKPDVWISGPRKTKTKADDTPANGVGKLIEKIKKLPAMPAPSAIAPMLASVVKEPFDDAGWRFEIKWDGYRTIAMLNKSKVKLSSRNNKSFNEKFSAVYDELVHWNINVVLDGEIVAVDKKGISRFTALQNWNGQSKENLLYYVFDILWLEGKDLTKLPLRERIQVLQSLPLLQSEGIVRTGFSVAGRGKDFFSQAKRLGLEGIIAKKSDSIYEPGIRSHHWLKIKIAQAEEAVIIGYTHKKGSPKLFSSLLLARYNGDALYYAGRVGTGFTESRQKELLKAFKPFVTQRSPLKEIPDMKGPAPFQYNSSFPEITWLKPQLVAQVQYTEVTEDGLFRHPSFVGLREDKDAKDVKYESPAIKKPGKTTFAVKKKKTTTGKKETSSLKTGEGDVTQKINGKSLTFTNLDKLYWPEKKITKGRLLEYYRSISSYMLPYIKNRPQSLYRFPDGYKGKSFYQKDVKDKVPDWMETLPYKSEDDNTQKEFLVAKDEASLLYMVNFGCIEINPWSSTVKKPENPDWCLLDIDPSKTNTFSQVIEVAQGIHQLLEKANIPSCPKTSGSTGMHIYIPLGTKYDYEQSREFARIIVTLVQQQLPKLTSIERQVNKRKGRIYLDFLQNRQQATLAAPYAVRPKKEATVSMPLHWKEVKEGLRMEDFTLENVPTLLKKRGDIFTPVLGRGINMEQCLKRLQLIEREA